MKIVLNKTEVAAVKDIFVKADTSVNIGDVLNKKLVKVSADILTGNVTVTIKDEYVAEFLITYGKYIGLLLPQLKGVVSTVKSMANDLSGVVVKYSAE